MTNIEVFISKIKTILEILPVHTQLSFSTIEKGKTKFYGLNKDENGIGYLNNQSFAFEIGSVTKAFTGNILAQLIDEGKVKLDDPIRNFLSFELKGNPSITFKHLAQHTSGLPRMPKGYDDRENFIKENPFSNYSEEELISYLTKKLEIESEPGEKAAYSNLGSGVLSYIISKIEERPFSEIVEEKIFRPLNMSNSKFNVKDISTNMIKGLDKEGNFTSFWDGGILNGCLGIISTTEDLAKFAGMTLDPLNNPVILQVKHVFPAKPEIYTNLGWLVINLPGVDPVLKINGGTAGYAASIFVNREKQKAFTFCSNIQPDRYMELIEPLCIETVK